MSNELGEFLRSCRARIGPEEVGLPRGDRRRVPGLRRDELAHLAGVSVEYYTRLEQGRSPNVSDAVLDAVALALRLNETEHAHLRNLIRPARRSGPAPRGPRIRGSVAAILDRLDAPAFLMGRRLDVLAWNRLGDALSGFSAMTDRNLARHVFLDPTAARMYPQWESVAADTVAFLRLTAGWEPGDPKLQSLVGELSIHSKRFRELWARNEVKDKTFGRKLIVHPVVGELDLAYETLLPAGDRDQLLITYVADEGSPSAEQLALLASWSQPGPEDPVAVRGRVGVPADEVE